MHCMCSSAYYWAWKMCDVCEFYFLWVSLLTMLPNSKNECTSHIPKWKSCSNQNGQSNSFHCFSICSKLHLHWNALKELSIATKHPCKCYWHKFRFFAFSISKWVSFMLNAALYFLIPKKNSFILSLKALFVYIVANWWHNHVSFSCQWL